MTREGHRPRSRCPKCRVSGGGAVWLCERPSERVKCDKKRAWAENTKGVPDTRQMGEGEGERVGNTYSFSSSRQPDSCPTDSRRSEVVRGECRVPVSGRCRVHPSPLPPARPRKRRWPTRLQ